MNNKLLHKFPAAKGFQYWIQKANELYRLRHPPCCEPYWQSKWRDRIRQLVRHLLYCRFRPWNQLPHKPGFEVESRIAEAHLVKDSRFPK